MSTNTLTSTHLSLSRMAPLKIELFPYPGLAWVDREILPQQTGRVRFMGTFWRARLLDRTLDFVVQPQSFVQVVGHQGITLLVAPSVSVY